MQQPQTMKYVFVCCSYFTSERDIEDAYNVFSKGILKTLKLGVLWMEFVTICGVRTPHTVAHFARMFKLYLETISRSMLISRQLI